MRVVRSRIIIFVGGFERKSPDAFFQRLDKQAAISAKTWDFEIEPGAQSYREDDKVASCAYVMRDKSGLSCTTDFHLLDIDDWVKADNERTAWTRIGHYLRSFSDYMFTGTGFRFFTANWRFALYFFYPFVALVLALLLGMFVARFTSQFSVLAAMLAGIGVTVLMVTYLTKRYFLLHLMDLWSFSADYIHRLRPAVRERVGSWGEIVAGMQADKNVDEILLVGHSTGGAIILDVAAQTARCCQEKSIEPRFTILTIGSTSLKIGLHPTARWYAEQAAELESNRQVHWFEYQCLTDLINFYRCDPFALMGLKKKRAAPFPAFERVRISHMLSPSYYRKIRLNLLRVHYQFISGNSEKYYYDFPVICFGAVSLADRYALVRKAFGVVTQRQVGVGQ